MRRTLPKQNYTCTIVANIVCQLDYIWNHLNTKHACEGYSWLDHLGVGRKTHSYSGHTSDGSSRKRTWKEGTFAFCLFVLTLTVLTLTVHLSCCWGIHLLVLEPTSEFFRIDWRPVLSSLGILWNSSTRWRLLDIQPHELITYQILCLSVRRQ